MRIKLRLEPYDPDARDADGDGIVQEGTAWERPAGTKILDDLGKEIARGLTSPYRNTSFKIIDRNGRNLDYRPTYGTEADLNPKESKPTLEKLGYQTLKVMGLPTVGDTVLPSTKPRVETAETPTPAPVSRPRYPRIPPAHAMTGLAEEKFGSAKTWEEFREIMKDTDIVFLDYETTGIVFDEFGRASSNGKPTQIGAVRMRDGKVIERFNVFVNPGMPMSDWEQWSRENLTDSDGNKLTDEFFDDKPSIEEAHRMLIDFIGEGTILGMQNAVFDDGVLADALSESGIEWKPAGIIDTKEMSSMALPRWTPENPDGPNRVDPRTGETVPSNGLADITRYLGVDLGDKHHSADYDAEATGNVLTRIADEAIANNWSTDFLNKEKRDSKLAANEAKFQQEIAKFEAERAIWEENQAEVNRIEQQNRLDEQQSALSALLSEIAEDGDGWEAGGKEAGELMRQWEEGELPEDFDDAMLDQEMFATGEDAREMRFQRLESEISPEGAETLRVWIDGREGATYSIRDEIEDRFLKPEDRAGQLADLVSPDRNSDAWKREYESQLSRIQRIQYRSDGAEALLEMIDNSPIQNQPLYRGMMLSPEQLDKLVQSGRINFPIGATSSSRNSALEYADRGGNQSVLFEIEGARAFPAHLFSRVDENEFLVSGEFEIVSVSREDSFNGPVPVVKIRPTGRTYREHGRELLSGRDSGVVAPDGTDLHVQEIQAKQSADDASKILSRSAGQLSPQQEDALIEVGNLISAIRQIGAGIDEDEFIVRYATDPDTSDLRGIIDPWSARGPVGDLARMLPREIRARDGSTFGVRPDLIEVSQDGTILIEGLLLDEAGREIGGFSRFFDLDGEKNLVAHHTVLDIGPEFRDKGIGSAFNAQLELAYRRLGVERIEVDATSQIRYEGDEKTPMDIQRGVSFWPRQGYDWQNAMGQETSIKLFDRLFIDGGKEPNPDSVYIEGVSSGPPPQGPERFDIAYFASQDEWDSFADSFARVRVSEFTDPDRPVAGDLMRWAGVDEWVARRTAGYSPIYVKALNQPTMREQTPPETEKILSRSYEFSPERAKAISDVSALFQDFLESGKKVSFSYDFGYVDIDEELTDEDSDLADGKKFGMNLLKVFEGSFESRDGSSIVISPQASYSYYGAEESFSIVGQLVDLNGNIVGTFGRRFRLTKDDDGNPVLVVEHDSLNIKPNSRGQGIGSAFNAQMEIIYRQLGAREIQTNGISGGPYDNQHIGATHWPRSGFDWATDFSKDEYIRLLDELVIFDDETDTYTPSGGAFVEGLSSGQRPVGADRRSIAYFSSVDEWERFVELLEQARSESLSDTNRVVAGDLVRWDGADDWFAGGEYSFDYVKRLKES